MMYPNLDIESTQPSDLPQYTDTPGYQESLNKMLHEAVLLSDEIFELREVHSLPP